VFVKAKAYAAAAVISKTFFSALLPLPFLVGAAFLASCSSDEPAPVAPQSTPKLPYAGTQAPARTADTEVASVTTKDPVVGETRTTASGLQYEVLRQGTGRRPNKFNRVRVHYHGYTPSGTVFDSSVDRGEPSEFALHQVIPGWTEGLQLMREGAKYRFRIPHYLAYGEAGSPPKIGPRQTLMFDIELIQILP
jgi:FKBP-type peptidyl-prolyl cis-trans isomerase